MPIELFQLLLGVSLSIVGAGAIFWVLVSDSLDRRQITRRSTDRKRERRRK